MFEEVFTEFMPYEPALTNKLQRNISKYISHSHLETTLTVSLSSVLDAEQLEDLQDVIDNNSPLVLEYEIYNHMPPNDYDRFEWPTRINYKIEPVIRLHPDRKRLFGEPQSTIYYAKKVSNSDGSYSYSNPVVKESFFYTRDQQTGMLKIRRTYIQWYFSDASLDNKYKLRFKDDYLDDLTLSIKEVGSVREYNVLEIIKMITILILTTDDNFSTTSEVFDEGRRFFEIFIGERELYIKDGNLSFENSIRDQDTDQITGDFHWLENNPSPLGIPLNSIRSYIIHELSRGRRIS